MTTYSQAIDDMFTLFRMAWNAGAAVVVGSVPAIRWEGVQEPSIPPVDAYWCRVSTQQVAEPQSSFKTGIAPDANRRYTAIGVLFVQIFCPMSEAQAMEKGRLLAELARNAFRGKETANQVWFRNVRIQRLAPEQNYYRFNVVAEYTYDDIG
jgi:hypothetical protein